MKNSVKLISLSLLLLSSVLHSCKKEEIPIVTTSAITNITGTTVTCGGTITDEGSGTVLERGVCWSTGITPTTADSKTTDGAGAGSFTSNITGLNGATTYYVRAYATNSAGTGYGMAMSFTTLGQVPSAITQSATNVTSTSATLNASINANYLSTTVTFEYGTSTNYGNSVPISQNPVTGNSSTTVSLNVSGLIEGKTYHFRVKTENSLGIIYGSDVTFTTLGQVPTATTLTASDIQLTSVTLNGSVNANYLSTSVVFEYGTTTSYGSSVTATPSLVTGNTPTSVSANISILNAGTTYHFRIKTENSLGTTNGSDMIFTTLGQAPTVTTQPASNVQILTAKLNGIVNPNYLSTGVTFECGLSTDYGNIISAVPSPITGFTNISVSADITSLSGGTTYHYRVIATNSLGTTNGNDMTFITKSSDGITDYENNYYPIVTIGSQLWMAVNLKATKYNDGTPIDNVTDNTVWAGLTTSAYCWYNNDNSNKIPYGALYNWYAVDVASNGGKNVCPTGWHVPTSTELIKLTTYLGGESVVGGKLKEAGTTHWFDPDGATNESGFTARGAGYRMGEYLDFDGWFENLKYETYFWSSTSYDTNNAWVLGLLYTDISGHVGGSGGKNVGFSVRCLKD